MATNGTESTSFGPAVRLWDTSCLDETADSGKDMDKPIDEQVGPLPRLLVLLLCHALLPAGMMLAIASLQTLI